MRALRWSAGRPSFLSLLRWRILRSVVALAEGSDVGTNADAKPIKAKKRTIAFIKE